MNDWMKNIPDNTLISEINLPGTHDSATRFCQFPYVAKCQSLSIAEQLSIGVRFLDLRVEKKDKKLRLVHARARCYKNYWKTTPLMLDDIINECKYFLNNNPSETIIISIKRDNGDSSEATFDTFFESYLNDDIWYKENRIPSLHEVRGKAVFFNRFNIDKTNENYTDFNTGLNFSNWPDQGKYIGKTHLSSVMERHDNTQGSPIFMQDWYKLPPKEKWENCILPTLENPPCKTGVFLNFFSSGGVVNNPKKCAKYILAHFLEAELAQHKNYGWLIFDFPTEKICRKVVLSNF